MSITRYHSLDSLRGIASFQVFLGHFLVAIPTLSWLVYDSDEIKHNSAFFIFHSPLHFFWSASPAVIIFFVLSGFVLSLPYYSGVNPSYKIFIIKRIVRLYIPCIVSMFLGYIVYKLCYESYFLINYATWVKSIWSNLNKANVLNFILLKDSLYYVPATWTLPVEIKLSLILPLFVKLQKKLSVSNSIFLFISIPIITTFIGKLIIYKLFPDFRIMFYFTFFTLGSTLCKYRVTLVSMLNSLDELLFFSLLFFFLLLFTIDYNTWILPANFLAIYKQVEQYIIAIPAAGFVLYSLTERFNKAMNSSLLVYIGKISFSLYLTHQITFVTIVLVSKNIYSKDTYLLISFPIAILVAILFFYLVELPTLNLNKFITKKLNLNSPK